MAKGGGGFTGKPMKGTMGGRDYGQAVSEAARAKTPPTQSQGTVRSMDARSHDVMVGRMKPVTPKTPTAKRRA